MGKSCSFAAFSIHPKTLYTYSVMIGFSTIVSLQTTYMCRLNWKGYGKVSLILSKAIHTNVSKAVESFPPLNPIIHGLGDGSAYVY